MSFSDKNHDNPPAASSPAPLVRYQIWGRYGGAVQWTESTVGDWVRYDDVAAHIADLEARLAERESQNAGLKHAVDDCGATVERLETRLEQAKNSTRWNSACG